MDPVPMDFDLEVFRDWSFGKNDPEPMDLALFARDEGERDAVEEFVAIEDEENTQEACTKKHQEGRSAGELEQFMSFYQAVFKYLRLENDGSFGYKVLNEHIELTGCDAFPQGVDDVTVLVERQFDLSPSIASKMIWENIKETKEINLNELFIDAPLSPTFSGWAIGYLKSRLDNNMEDAGQILEMEAKDRITIVGELTKLHLQHGTLQCIVWFESLFSRFEVESSIIWGCDCTSCKGAFPQSVAFLELRKAIDFNEEAIPSGTLSSFRLTFTRFKAKQLHDLLVAHSEKHFISLGDDPRFIGWKKSDFDAVVSNAHNEINCRICSAEVQPPRPKAPLAPKQLSDLETSIIFFRICSSHLNFTVAFGRDISTIKTMVLKEGIDVLNKANYGSYFQSKFRERRTDRLRQAWKDLEDSNEGLSLIKLLGCAPLTDSFQSWFSTYLKDRKTQSKRQNTCRILNLPREGRTIFVEELVRLHIEYGTLECELWFRALFSPADIEAAIFWGCKCRNCTTAFPQVRQFDEEQKQFEKVDGELSRNLLERYRVSYVRLKAQQYCELLEAHEVGAMENLYSNPLFCGWKERDFESALAHAHKGTECKVCLQLEDSPNRLQSTAQSTTGCGSKDKDHSDLLLNYQVFQAVDSRLKLSQRKSASHLDFNRLRREMAEQGLTLPLAYRTNFTVTLKKCLRVSKRFSPNAWTRQSLRIPFSSEFKKAGILPRLNEPRLSILTTTSEVRIPFVEELVRLHRKYGTMLCEKWFSPLFSPFHVEAAIFWECRCENCLAAFPGVVEFDSARRASNAEHMSISSHFLQEFFLAFTKFKARQYCALLNAHRSNSIASLQSSDLFKGCKQSSIERSLALSHDMQLCDICNKSLQRNAIKAVKEPNYAESSTLRTNLRFFEFVAQHMCLNGEQRRDFECLQNNMIQVAGPFPKEYSGSVELFSKTFKIHFHEDISKLNFQTWEKVKKSEHSEILAAFKYVPFSEGFLNWLKLFLQKATVSQKEIRSGSSILQLPGQHRVIIVSELVRLHQLYGTRQSQEWFKPFFPQADIEMSILWACSCEVCASQFPQGMAFNVDQRRSEDSSFNIPRDVLERFWLEFTKFKGVQYSKVIRGIAESAVDNLISTALFCGWTKVDFEVAVKHVSRVPDSEDSCLNDTTFQKACMAIVHEPNDLRTYLNFFSIIGSEGKVSIAKRLTSAMTEYGPSFFPSQCSGDLRRFIWKLFREQASKALTNTWHLCRTAEYKEPIVMQFFQDIPLTTSFFEWVVPFIVGQAETSSSSLLPFLEFETYERVRFVQELVRLHREYGTPKCKVWFKGLFGETDIERAILWGCRCQNCLSSFPELVNFGEDSNTELKLSASTLDGFGDAYLTYKARQYHKLLLAHQSNLIHLLHGTPFFYKWDQRHFDEALEQVHNRSKCEACCSTGKEEVFDGTTISSSVDDLSAQINLFRLTADYLQMGTNHSRDYVSLQAEVLRQGVDKFPNGCCSKSSFSTVVTQAFRESYTRTKKRWMTINRSTTFSIPRIVGNAPLSSAFSNRLSTYLQHRMSIKGFRSAGRILEMQADDRMDTVNELVILHRTYGTTQCKRWFGKLFPTGDVECAIYWGCRCTNCLTSLPEIQNFNHLHDFLDGELTHIPKMVLERFRFAFLKFKARQNYQLLVAHKSDNLDSLRSNPLFKGWSDDDFAFALNDTHNISVCKICRMNDEVHNDLDEDHSTVEISAEVVTTAVADSSIQSVLEGIDTLNLDLVSRMFKILADHLSLKTNGERRISTLSVAFAEVGLQKIAHLRRADLRRKVRFVLRETYSAQSKAVWASLLKSKVVDISELVNDAPLSATFKAWLFNYLTRRIHNDETSAGSITSLQGEAQVIVMKELVRLHLKYGTTQCELWFRSLFCKSDIESSILWACRCEKCTIVHTYLSDKTESVQTLPCSISPDFLNQLSKFKAKQLHDLLRAFTSNQIPKLRSNSLYTGWEQADFHHALLHIRDVCLLPDLRPERFRRLRSSSFRSDPPSSKCRRV